MNLPGQTATLLHAILGDEAGEGDVDPHGHWWRGWRVNALHDATNDALDSLHFGALQKVR